MLGETGFRVGIQLAYGGQMHITTIEFSTCRTRLQFPVCLISAYLRMVIRRDLSIARSCRSSMMMHLSCLWFFVVQ